MGWRVLLVIRSASGGMLKHLKDLIEGLGPEGFQVEVAGPGEVLKELSRSYPDYPSHRVVMTDGIHLFNELRLLVTLSSLIKKGNYDLIHLHGYKAAFLGYISARLGCARHIIATVHNSWPFTGRSPSQRVLGALSGFSLRRCEWVIAVSGAVRRGIVDYGGLCEEKVVTIYNGIRLDEAGGLHQEGEPYHLKGGLSNGEGEEEGVKGRVGAGVTYDPIDELFSTPGLFIVGTVARLIPAKGIFDLLRAAQKVLTEVPQVRFLIVGDGPSLGELLRERDVFGLTERVIFAGHRNDVPYILSRIHLFVLPSHSEGLPFTILEAMAASRAVLATAVGGIPEVITHGETGFLVPPNEPEELARGVIELFYDNDLRLKLAEAGRRRVIEDFTLERMIRETAGVYRAVIEGRPLAPNYVR